MKSTRLVITAAIALLSLCGARAAENSGSEKMRFAPIHIFIDSGTTPLAAYQFELRAVHGTVKIVGIEGGEHPAYKDAPYYDPAAMAHDRVIVGAYSIAKDLPTGRSRVATIHVMIEGDIQPEYEVTLITAGNADGNPITAQITLEKGDTR